MLNTASDSLAETAYRELRRQILLGLRRPLSPLRLEGLKGEFGMGFSPLREAMMRLRSEGLVDMHAQRGFRVAPATLENFDDLMQSRARVEALLLQDAIAAGDEDWEASIVGAFHRLSRRAPIDPTTGLVSEAWDEAHRSFHVSIVSASASECLKSFWMSLFDRGQRYRQIAVTRGGSMRDDCAEHHALLDAVVGRRLEDAQSASRSHIENTRAVVHTLLHRGPGETGTGAA